MSFDDGIPEMGTSCRMTSSETNEDKKVAPMEIDSELSEHESIHTNEHYLRVLPLAMIVFYNVSGGPFGIEESVRSAGFFISILGFLLMPLVWSIPEALMTAELGSAYPEASGGVAWVEEAFGPAAGWQAGFLGWIAGATDNAIYPTLFLDYVFQLWKSNSDEDIHPILRFALMAATSIIMGYLNWLGLNVVGNLSIAIGVLSMAPFVIFSVLGIIQKIDTRRWLELPVLPDNEQSDGGIISVLFSGAILWRPLLNNLFWNLNSFDSTASYAGNIRDPGSVLPRALFLGVAFMMVGYLVPLLIAIGATNSEPADWVDGYLTTAASDVGGEWLGACVVFAAGVSNIALFQAELSADSFQLMGMAERGFLPKIFATQSRHGTPTYGIVLGVAVIIAMGTWDLEKLIEMLNWNYAVSLLMEYSAFIKLRVSKPNVSRPFRLPLGVAGCILVCVPPVIGTGIVMILASWSTILVSVAMNLVGVLIYCCGSRSWWASSNGREYSKVENSHAYSLEATNDLP